MQLLYDVGKEDGVLDKAAGVGEGSLIAAAHNSKGVEIGFAYRGTLTDESGKVPNRRERFGSSSGR